MGKGKTCLLRVATPSWMINCEKTRWKERFWMVGAAKWFGVNAVNSVHCTRVGMRFVFRACKLVESRGDAASRRPQRFDFPKNNSRPMTSIRRHGGRSHPHCQKLHSVSYIHSFRGQNPFVQTNTTTKVAWKINLLWVVPRATVLPR